MDGKPESIRRPGGLTKTFPKVVSITQYHNLKVALYLSYLGKISFSTFCCKQANTHAKYKQTRFRVELLVQAMVWFPRWSAADVLVALILARRRPATKPSSEFYWSENTPRVALDSPRQRAVVSEITSCQPLLNGLGEFTICHWNQMNPG